MFTREELSLIRFSVKAVNKDSKERDLLLAKIGALYPATLGTTKVDPDTGDVQPVSIPVCTSGERDAKRLAEATGMTLYPHH